MLIRLLLICLTYCFSTLALAEETTINLTPPFTTNATITGRYYFAYEHYIRDAYITTPINGKFYFKLFIAQTPTQAAMTVQYYNEIDGVATFDKNGVGYFFSPHNNCDLKFVFKPPLLLIEQDKNCGMSAEIGMEARGVYTQLEEFSQ